MPIDNPHWYRKWTNMLVVSIDLISHKTLLLPLQGGARYFHYYSFKNVNMEAVSNYNDVLT